MRNVDLCFLARLETKVPRASDNTDDLAPYRPAVGCPIDAQPLADRIFARPVHARRQIADHCNMCRTSPVAFIEHSATEHRNAHGPEVVARYTGPVGLRAVVARLRLRTPFNPKTSLVVDPA